MELANRRIILLASALDIIFFIISLSLDVSLPRIANSSGHGIWCGLLYLVAGCLGLAIIYLKQEQSIVKVTFIVSCLAVLFGIISIGLSADLGQRLGNLCLYISHAFCHYESLAWGLMSISIFAAILNGVFAYYLYPNAYKQVPTNPA